MITSLNIYPTKRYKLQKFTTLYLKSILDIIMAIALFQEEQKALYFNDKNCARADSLGSSKLNPKILKASQGLFIHEIDFP